ncbi:hypothetical protein [Alicyclobacillus sp. SO9]|uniref:hypothetical protein n=1 Tax=Alicyclobacillus sp. SO9 TaxID=2665646 RepID=UPI0018E86A85|nr:hypothetical protein [Alicyclobacillus sp. SO9]QQE79228.1 hypothetical protein GI364_01565 [Alicyclobacillus sp. SO9]
MRYKTNAIAMMSPFASFFVIFFAVADIVSAPYKSIFWATGLAYITGWTILTLRLFYKYRTLSVEEDALIFPKRRIQASELRKVRFSEQSHSCLLYFKGRKYPLTIEFGTKDKDSVVTQLRGWCWRNRVTVETSGKRGASHQ